LSMVPPPGSTAHRRRGSSGTKRHAPDPLRRRGMCTSQHISRTRNWTGVKCASKSAARRKGKAPIARGLGGARVAAIALAGPPPTRYAAVVPRAATSPTATSGDPVLRVGPSRWRNFAQRCGGLFAEGVPIVRGKPPEMPEPPLCRRGRHGLRITALQCPSYTIHAVAQQELVR